jgi:hypothetical protein
MRVLIDESLPGRFASAIAGHEARTARQMGWLGLGNGELLRRAAGAGFDALLTADQNLEYQQNIARSGLGLIVLIAPTNSPDSILPLAPLVLKALASLRAGQVVRIGERPRRNAGGRPRRRRRRRQGATDDSGGTPVAEARGPVQSD